MSARVVVAVLVLAAASPVAAEPSGEALWDEGRPAAAGAAFERQWERAHEIKDGLNAVIAFRVAGRYARARALLARVVDGVVLAADLAEKAELLDERLTELTTELVVRGELGADAELEVDGNPVAKIGARVVIDPGVHEISIARPHCEPWSQRVEAVPSESLVLDVTLRCPGRVHLVFLGERDAALRIDDEPRRAGAGELELELEPGAHHVEVVSAIGSLLDERITVAAGDVTHRRVDVPWRSSGGMWFLATSGSVHVGTPGESGFVGAGIGRAHHRGRWYFDLGMGRQPDGLAVGGSAGLELTRHLIRPLWRGRAAGAWWHAVVEPASLWMRVMSRFGPRVIAFDGSAGEVQDVTTLHAGSVGITVDAASWHGEVMVWPVGGFLRWGDRAELGVGVAASLLLGFRI